MNSFYIEKMKLHRNIFLSTLGVTVAAFIVFAIYMKMVIRMDAHTFRNVMLEGMGFAVLSVAVSMAIHFVDLRFAVKLLQADPEARYPKPEDWLEVDRKLADYPRKQATGTALIWTVALCSLALIFTVYTKWLSSYDAVFLVFGGVFMGIITGGYNYFFFKIHLAPVRRELAPSQFPLGWLPSGGMRSALTYAFISICMALTVFPSIVLFQKIMETRTDSVRVGYEALLTLICAQMSEKSGDNSGAILSENSSMLSSASNEIQGNLLIIDLKGNTLFGPPNKFLSEYVNRINDLKNGFLVDNASDNIFLFRTIDKTDLKAVIVWSRGDFILQAAESLKFLLTVIGLALLMAIGLIILLRRYIGVPIGNLVSDVQAVSQGDFDRRIGVSSDGELGTLELSLGAMKRKLVALIETQQDLVTRVGFSIGQLSHSAAELREISEEQAAGSAEQASAAHEAGVTAEEVKNTSNLVADRIEAVSQMAAETLEHAKKGASSATETVVGIKNVENIVNLIANKMLSLGKSISKVGMIAETIEEISHKTNLLAINAGIEAAGAGEAGERFGIVAGEIRRFAKTTAETAEEVRRQAEEIRKAAAESVIFTEEGTKSVGAGLRKVENVAKAFKFMEDIAAKTNMNAQEISMSSRQQTTASEQMVETMGELADVAAENAKGAKKIEAAIGELDRLADELRKMVSIPGDDTDIKIIEETA